MTLPSDRLSRITLTAAGLALVAYAVAGILLMVPVSVPQVQDCGAPGAYLLAGRTDIYPDRDNAILSADGTPTTLDAEVAEAARRRPCQDRVASRAVPAAVAATAATFVGLVAFGVELTVSRPAARRAIRQSWADAPPIPDPDPAPDPLGASPGDDPGLSG